MKFRRSVTQYDTQYGETIQSPKKIFPSEERLLPSVMQTR